MPRQVIHTDKAPAPIGPYSQAIKTGDTVYVSGQGGLVPETMQLAGPTVAAQTEQTLRNIAAILEAAGTDLAHVVKVNVLLADINTFSEMNEVYRTFFPIDPPARMTYAVRDLPLGVLVEIDAVAVMPD
ncbi:MAG: reactive intermediate/imine deaminase [Anaerolineae bacterium]|nr:MAG: reactive intermediate/imine deaminase [Anaerolineae bacterium]